MGKTLTTGQLSRITGIAMSTINERCRDGRIRAIRPCAGLRWRIPIEEARRIAAMCGKVMA
jgi:excisionase family DNA binding protein